MELTVCSDCHRRQSKCLCASTPGSPSGRKHKRSWVKVEVLPVPAVAATIDALLDLLADLRAEGVTDTEVRQLLAFRENGRTNLERAAAGDLSPLRAVLKQERGYSSTTRHARSGSRGKGPVG